METKCLEENQTISFYFVRKQTELKGKGTKKKREIQKIEKEVPVLLITEELFNS